MACISAAKASRSKHAILAWPIESPRGGSGAINTEAPAVQYDPSTVVDLLNLTVELGLFKAN